MLSLTSPIGDVQAAGAHLQQVFGQEPREASAQARWAVVEVWGKNFRGAAQRLVKVAEREPSTLDFLLQLISPTHRKRLAQVKCFWCQYRM